MSQFVATLRNPVYREKLRTILGSGRGIFRQFKDALSERPDIERLWLAFKQRAMREIVAEWLNDLRELWGLERLALPEEDTEELVAADFTCTDGGTRGAQLVRELDKEAFAESLGHHDPKLVDVLYEQCRAGKPDPADPESRVLLAETPSREVAGFLWAVTLRGEDVTVSSVTQVYVLPEYRGVGIARALLTRHLTESEAAGCSDVFVELIGNGCDLQDGLSELGFSAAGTTMHVRLGSWLRQYGGW
jgi:ribosomal protein S18 acetylase RimI-like enzyme